MKAPTIAIDARKVQDFGIGTYVRQLVRQLARLDTENRFLLLVRPQDADVFGDLPAHFSLLIERAPVYSLREAVTVSWHLHRQKVDLYHATHYVLPAWLPPRVVVTIHDIIHLLFPEHLPNRFAGVYANRMIKRGVHRSDAVITVSQNTKEDLLEHFNVDPGKLHVVYNGVDPRFSRRLQPEELRQQLAELGVEPPYLLFVGNPKPHKNLGNVMRAFARAAESLPDQRLPLVCVGAKKTDLKARALVSQLGIGDRIVHLGHVAEEALEALYQGALVFLYPTLYEGFGLPVLEAMASGTTVVTSNNSSLAEIAAGAAHLVSPTDVEDIAAGILRCLRDADYRARLVTAGEARAREFQWQTTAEKTLKLYDELLAKR